MSLANTAAAWSVSYSLSTLLCVYFRNQLLNACKPALRLQCISQQPQHDAAFVFERGRCLTPYWSFLNVQHHHQSASQNHRFSSLGEVFAGRFTPVASVKHSYAHACFRRGMLFHQVCQLLLLLPAERKKLCEYESLDYLPPNSSVYKAWLRSQPHGCAFGSQTASWVGSCRAADYLLSLSSVLFESPTECVTRLNWDRFFMMGSIATVIGIIGYLEVRLVYDSVRMTHGAKVLLCHVVKSDPP
jgi:hypothetical protein